LIIIAIVKVKVNGKKANDSRLKLPEKYLIQCGAGCCGIYYQNIQKTLFYNFKNNLHKLALQYYLLKNNPI